MVSGKRGFPSHPVATVMEEGRLGGWVRSAEEWELVTRWIAWGLNDCQIARLTGIPRSTIRDWRHLARRPGVWAGGDRRADCPICHDLVIDNAGYSYLFGLYLGDGCISEAPKNVFKLRIVLDCRYPNIIREAGEAMLAMRPTSPMRVGKVARVGCIEVVSHWKHWPCLFPQHGPGSKLIRRIELKDWQQEIVDSKPGALLKGLIHSDGYRGLNHVNGKGYPRYLFTNFHEDIRRIFCMACDAFGVEWRQSKWNTISVARRDSVAKLDTVVGPKS